MSGMTIRSYASADSEDCRDTVTLITQLTARIEHTPRSSGQRLIAVEHLGDRSEGHPAARATSFIVGFSTMSEMAL